MIFYSDKEYIETKLIMQGRTTMRNEFRPLAEWIDKEFCVKTVNIIYDTIDEGQRPRLQIYFEFEKEQFKFMNKGALGMNKSKQEKIANKFKELMKIQGFIKRTSTWDFLKLNKEITYITDNVWVIFGAFEPTAKMEANKNVPQNKLTDLEKSLANPDLWGINKSFSSAGFFVYTDEMVEIYKNSETLKIWADKYFDILDDYNEFGYFKRENFSIFIDSKENFDNNYQSNWYYYYK